jgi:7-carboxy-7-deazaguanine synthase
MMSSVKQVAESGKFEHIPGFLPVMEEYYTIQGEGYHSGKAAYFVRLAGCNVGCVWCDVKDSWDVTLHPLTDIQHIRERVKDSGARNVVITGGEPLMHQLDEICDVLKGDGLKLWIETSGAYPLSGSWDWICVSPKKFMEPLGELLTTANELKVIVFNESDLKWARDNYSKTNRQCLLYLQPEFSRFERVLPVITDYVKTNPQWTISLQTHKFMNIP